MDFINTLKKLGLKDKEPSVYLALLKTPGFQPASIIAKKANLNRSTTYKTLTQLNKKGLVAKTTRQEITCFFVPNPEEKLLQLINNEKNSLNLAKKSILELLPNLISNTCPDEFPKFRYYEGIEGIKQVYELLLETKQEIYRYGDITKIYDALGPYTDEYIKKRNKLGITTHAIMPLKKEDKKEISKNKNENRKVLYIPEKEFIIDGEIRIFGNKVAIMSLKKENPIAVVIECETIAEMFYSIFMLTWKSKHK